MMARLIEIEISRPDSEGRYWIGRGVGKRKVSTFSYDCEGAMQIAEREFKNAGGEGKAIIIDRNKKK